MRKLFWRRNSDSLGTNSGSIMNSTARSSGLRDWNTAGARSASFVNVSSPHENAINDVDKPHPPPRHQLLGHRRQLRIEPFRRVGLALQSSAALGAAAE